MKRDKFDDILQQKLHDMEMEITPTSWEQLERRLILDERERAVEHPRSGRLSLWKYAVAAAVIVAIGVGGVLRFGLDKIDDTADIAELKEVVQKQSIISYDEIASTISPGTVSNENKLSSLFKSARSISVKTDLFTGATVSGGVDITDPDIISYSGSNSNDRNNSTFTSRNSDSDSRNRNYNASYYSRRLSDYYDDWPYDEQTKRKNNRPLWVASIYSGTLSQSNGGKNLTAMAISRMSSYDGAIIEASYQNNSVDLNGVNLKHYLPVTVGLNIRKEISNHVSLQTGISYSFLEATAELDASFRVKYHQKIHYLGVPLAINYSVLKRNRFDLYLMGGVMMEKAIAAKSTTSFYSGNVFNSKISDKLSTKGLLWSANVGIGATYYLVNDFGIYLEVGGNYNFTSHDQPESYKTVNPWSASVRAGLAFRF